MQQKKIKCTELVFKVSLSCLVFLNNVYKTPKIQLIIYSEHSKKEHIYFMREKKSNRLCFWHLG